MEGETIHNQTDELFKRAQTLHRTILKNIKGYQEQLRTALRETLVQAIEESRISIMKRVEKERETTKEHIWIHTERRVSYSKVIPFGMAGHSYEFIFLKTIRLDTRPTNTTNDRYMLPEEFSKKVEELKKSIIRGEYDQHLKSEPERIIHEHLMPKPQA